MKQTIDHHTNTGYQLKMYPDLDNMDNIKEELYKRFDFDIDNKDNFTFRDNLEMLLDDIAKTALEFSKNDIAVETISIFITSGFDSIIILGNLDYITSPDTEYAKNNTETFIARVPQKVETAGFGHYYNDPVDRVELKLNNKIVATFNVDNFIEYD